MSKNKKNPKSEKKKQFPKNFRFITENPVSKFIHRHRRTLLISFAILLILLAISTVSLDAYINYQENKRFTKERIKIGKEIAFWQSTVDRFPNYRDAYFELALLNYQLKNFGKAREYLSKTFKLDPNFKEGKELENKLR